MVQSVALPVCRLIARHIRARNREKSQLLRTQTRMIAS